MLPTSTAETDRPVLWFWMLITGLGIGPSFAVFTLVVQNSVAAARIGVATGQPDVLPADRRDDRADPRRHRPRRPARDRDPEPAGRGRRAPADRRPVRRRRRAWTSPGRAISGSGSWPRLPPEAQAVDPAADPQHRPGHPRGVLARHRVHVLGRRRRARCWPSGSSCSSRSSRCARPSRSRSPPSCPGAHGAEPIGPRPQLLPERFTNGERSRPVTLWPRPRARKPRARSRAMRSAS